MNIDGEKPLILIGAGGHAKTLVDALNARSIILTAYVDPIEQPWLVQQGITPMEQAALERILPQGPRLIIGFVGLTPEAMQKRLEILRDYKKKGAAFPPVIHPSAIVSPKAKIAEGVQVGAGAIVHPYAVIHAGAVINTGAVVEHDAVIGEGTHIAPRAVVLGGAEAGECTFIGSQAVVVQGKKVPAGQFVKALTAWPKKSG